MLHYCHSVSFSEIKPKDLNMSFIFSEEGWRIYLIKLSKHFICSDTSVVLYVNSLPSAFETRIRCCNSIVIMSLQYIITHLNCCSMSAVYFWFIFLKDMTWEVAEDAGRHLLCTWNNKESPRSLG